MDPICEICEQKLVNGSAVCRLPCGHVKHIACLTELSTEQSVCCEKRFRLTAVRNYGIIFHNAPNSDNQMHGANSGSMQDSIALLANEELENQLEAAQSDIKLLQESNCDLQTKLQNSEAQLSKAQVENKTLLNSSSNVQTSRLIAAVKEIENGDVLRLQTELENKNMEIDRLNHSLTNKDTELENQRGLLSSMEEQLGKKDAEAAKLSFENALIKCKLSDCEEKLAAEDGGHRAQIAELQTEITKKSNEMAEVKRSLSDCQTRLADADKRNVDANKEMTKVTCDISDSQKRLAASEKRNVATNKEMANVKRDLSDTQNRLMASEKRHLDIIKENRKLKQDFSDSLEASNKSIADMKKEKQEMQEELKSWEHLRQLIGGAIAEIGKKKTESKGEQILQQQSPIVPPAVLKRQNPEDESNGESAKKARIDMQEKDEDGAEATNVASCCKADNS